MLYKQYDFIATRSAARRAILAARDAETCALDFETTSLSPADGRVRTVNLCCPAVRCVIDFDKVGGFSRYAKLFEGGSWIVFNSTFEGRWFQACGVTPALLDVGHLRRAVMGGGRFSLATMALWDLEVTMVKEEQGGDWSRPVLTQAQLDYAFFDGAVTWGLWRHWCQRAEAGHWGAFKLLNDMWPAVIEMEDAGIMLDKEHHNKLIVGWERDKVKRVAGLRKYVSDEEVPNINSDQQWSDYLSALLPDTFLQGWERTPKSGHLSMRKEIIRNIAAHVAGTPLAEVLYCLADYKFVTKYLSSFGQPLLTAAGSAGTVRARFNDGAAKTLRFSSSRPNVQQIPRDHEHDGQFVSVRKSFKARLGRSLVSLDYSGIELRVLALLAGDDALLEAVVNGDVHSDVGADMAGRKLNLKSRADKELRSKAKPVSFGIIYGIGAPGLAGSMRVSIPEAQAYIDKWEARYPQAFGLRHTMLGHGRRTGYLPMIDGGTIYVGKKVEMPKAANYPVQRAAWSVMAAAITRHKNTLDAERASKRQRLTQILATIHDAMIDEASKADASRCLKLLEQDMVAGFTDIFPDASTANLVEGGIGPNWSDLA